ncbi:MAG TPA: hypothetical protein VEA69_04045, partial [Tepidisphaeraceae bacterium]|nr:hypothetical protein [Tepidisphaeraceae bacterium]
DEVDERGEPIVGDTLFLALNAYWEEVPFTLPLTRPGHVWEAVLDTFDAEPVIRVLSGGAKYRLHGRSLALLRAVPAEASGQVVSPAQVEALRRAMRRGGPPAVAPLLP